MSYILVLNEYHFEFQHETAWFQALLRVWFKYLFLELEVTLCFIVKIEQRAHIKLHS